MKSALTLIAWAFVATVILFAAVNPNGGVAFQSPMAAIGLGMIGLGICMETRKKLLPLATATRKS